LLCYAENTLKLRYTSHSRVVEPNDGSLALEYWALAESHGWKKAARVSGKKKDSKVHGEARELSMINSFSRIKLVYAIEQFRYIEKLMLVGV
jgi:hypothetical protein